MFYRNLLLGALGQFTDRQFAGKHFTVVRQPDSLLNEEFAKATFHRQEGSSNSLTRQLVDTKLHTILYLKLER